MAISSDNFKVEFKRYKQRSQIPNFADVIDIIESASKVTEVDLKLSHICVVIYFFSFQRNERK